MDIRAIEKSKKLGYMFYIKYDGTKFFSFDEMKNKTTVKGKFKEIMDEIGFTWARGVQQAGRTDSKVSANENILYVSSNNLVEINKIIEKFNEKSEYLKITSCRLTLPNLAFPEFIEKREYIYRYPAKKIKRDDESIKKLCEELSGTYDVSKFTTTKGKNLKEHIRSVEIKYLNKKLFFLGDSFMPQQVRIMSGYILLDRKEAIEGKYLTLNKVYLKEELKSMILQKSNIEMEGVEYIYETSNKKLKIFFVSSENKGKLIGKNGKNIKSLKEKFGNIVVREI